MKHGKLLILKTYLVLLTVGVGVGVTFAQDFGMTPELNTVLGLEYDVLSQNEVAPNVWSVTARGFNGCYATLVRTISSGTTADGTMITQSNDRIVHQACVNGTTTVNEDTPILGALNPQTAGTTDTNPPTRTTNTAVTGKANTLTDEQLDEILDRLEKLEAANEELQANNVKLEGKLADQIKANDELDGRIQELLNQGNARSNNDNTQRSPENQIPGYCASDFVGPLTTEQVSQCRAVAGNGAGTKEVSVDDQEEPDATEEDVNDTTVKVIKKDGKIVRKMYGVITENGGFGMTKMVDYNENGKPIRITKYALKTGTSELGENKSLVIKYQYKNGKKTASIIENLNSGDISRTLFQKDGSSITIVRNRENEIIGRKKTDKDGETVDLGKKISENHNIYVVTGKNGIVLKKIRLYPETNKPRHVITYDENGETVEIEKFGKDGEVYARWTY